MLSHLSRLLVAGALAALISPSFVAADGDTPVGPFGLDNINCTSKFYTVQANSTNTKFVNIDQGALNQTVVTSLITLFSTAPENFTQIYTQGTFQHSSSYRIFGTLCLPIQSNNPATPIQLLVHGVGVDSRYWDFGFEEQYSYVRHAGSHGYTTFRYDRLGTGLSDTPVNGFDEAQAPTEVAILTSINRMLRETTAVGGRQWPKVVGIGHSYGSVQTLAVSAANPELYDGLVLQGLTANASSFPNYLQASAYQIARDTLDHLKNKPPAWLAAATPSTAQMPFWFFPGFENGAFELNRLHEQSVTLGVEFTLLDIVKVASNFTKPVQIPIGDKDFIFCGGNCLDGPGGKTLPELALATLFPNAPSEVYIIPNTGHAINQHISSSNTYEAMLNFLFRHNL